MANLSDATGNISFSPGFFERHKKEIEKWTQDVITSGDYGITSANFDEKSTIVQFSGCGRNTFSDTLTEDFVLLSDELMEALYNEGECIVISFTDYESGCQALYSEEGTVGVLRDIRTKMLFQHYSIARRVPLPYKTRLIVELGFEEAFDISNPTDMETVLEVLEIAGFTTEEQDKLIEIITEKDGGLIICYNLDDEKYLRDLLENEAS